MMEIEEIIKELENILKISNYGCLCGHFESCENCNPLSQTNKIRDNIKKLLNKLKK